MSLHLKGENLIKIYRHRKVVNDVTIEVAPGEIIGLLGPNGAGKTTTFYMLTGLVSPNTGKILIGSKNVTKLPMYRRARQGIGYLPQEPSIFRKLSVEENIMLILECLNIPHKEKRKRLQELIKDFKIEHIKHLKGYVLSGGERRRVEIARALSTQPLFLLLDEPFTGIDPISVQELQELMKNLKNRGIGILITDHNVRETLEITDKAYIMFDGKVLISGTPTEILNSDIAKRIYLGEKFQL